MINKMKITLILYYVIALKLLNSTIFPYIKTYNYITYAIHKTLPITKTIKTATLSKFGG